MTSSTSHSPQIESLRRESTSGQCATSPAIKEDVVEYLTDYAKQNPKQAALFCVAVGFVLGWKLKPW
jgi:hypothetical protein